MLTLSLDCLFLVFVESRKLLLQNRKQCFILGAPLEEFVVSCTFFLLFCWVEPKESHRVEYNLQRILSDRIRYMDRGSKFKEYDGTLRIMTAQRKQQHGVSFNDTIEKTQGV
ncbi:hypothetical protein PF010_g17099 [Phytophthora fragariae]|nr:hypothetical protein PF010_g17099 [Phytophthora fragariae]KAE9137737.1 hypothetical protein PF006_g14117 [Phytophthora fragariae]KAE9220487.1 hypothetical protein PF002_g15876 [Phytophthora fragariae]KAE9296135.1 hypothetical protein PF001_g17003 [Phytophthora fragariae]